MTADGRWLAFDADWNGNADLYRMRTDGGQPIPVTTDPAPEFAPAWSPDGTRIAFHGFESGNREIFTVNADGSGRERRTSSPLQELDVDWSPDGESLVFEVIGTGMPSFAVLPLAGASARSIDIVGDFAVWSPRGGLLAYHGLDGLRVVPVAGGASRLLVRFDDPTRQHARYGFATDDKRFWLTLGSHESDVWLLELERR